MPDADAREASESAPRQPKDSARVEHELQLYYWMKLIRAFEDRVARLSRQNKIFGGVYSGAGQEAICTGICAPLQPGDFVAPLHRDLGVFLMRGADPGRLMAQLMAKENGLSRGKDSGLHGGDLEHGIFGSTSMLGSSLPVAVGAALKFKMKKDKNIAVAFFGEGAASRGDVHEAMNFAGVHKLPVLFVCENNRFAYSTPLEKQMAIENVADRARAYGFPGHVVSGNDLLAVVALSAIVLALIRQVGVLHERIAPMGALTIDKGPKVGDKSPVFELVDLADRPVTLGAARTDAAASS